MADDRVFGNTGVRFGCHAEFACVPQAARMAPMPAGMGFAEAAAATDGALNALWCLRLAGPLQGRRVLVYGASGAIGTAAVQVAKFFGAEVTAVCGPTGVAVVEAIGADRVIDYTKEDRSGIRIPAIAISPWIPERTVITGTHRSTSLIHTLRQRWSLGEPLSAREAAAPDLRPVLSLETPRDPADWPDVHPQPVPVFTEAMIPPGLPLRGLARALFFAFLGLGQQLGQTVPDISPDATITGADGLTMIYDMFGHMFPQPRQRALTGRTRFGIPAPKPPDRLRLRCLRRTG